MKHIHNLMGQFLHKIPLQRKHSIEIKIKLKEDQGGL
jgi:hypothetical protein